MRQILRLSIIAFFALNISACAYTNKVVENSYRSKVRKECSLPTGGQDSIHQRQNSPCVDGIYSSKKKSKK